MKRIIYLPFEELPQRYTSMWNDAIRKNLTAEDLSVEIDPSERIIENGEFLDTFDTISYKQAQIGKVAELFKQGAIRSGDVFFVPDIFYPAIEAIKYIAELTGLEVKVATFNHAGRADKDDFVQALGPWADSQEQAWHDLSDIVLVGSVYHARRVVQKFRPKDCVVTGAVWDKEWMDAKCKGIDKGKKEDFVIYPHRPCKEKRFDFFYRLAERNPQTRFVVTTSGRSRLKKEDLPKNVEYLSNLTKREYFEVFAKAKGYLSTAYQETFGYTVQEAIYFGCQIICPLHACYPEYVAEPSLLTFAEMEKAGALDYLYTHSGEDLRQSKQFEDNAKKICRLLRNLE